MSSRKTLYQILALPATASDAEIMTAYQDMLQKLEQHREILNFEDFESKKKLIQMAYETLSDPLLRRKHDEKLMSRKAKIDTESSETSALTLMTPDALASKADALSLRAEAMALRADAFSIKCGILPYRNAQEAQLDTSQPSRSMFTWTRLLVLVGAVIALSMAAQTAIFYSAVRTGEAVGKVANTSQERAALQDYYQTFGVRPASIEEMRLLEKERLVKEKEERDMRDAERQRQREEDETRRFQEAARMEGARVSSDLARAEERLKYEEAQEQQKKESAEQRLREAQEEELRRARARWDKSEYGRGY